MAQQERQFQLSRQEVKYLRTSGFLPDSLLRVLEAAREDSDGASTVSIPRDLAEAFRAALTDRLASVGFRADYEPTSEGKMIEALIDRFYMS